jgi:hypothetical protein
MTAGVDEPSIGADILEPRRALLLGDAEQACSALRDHVDAQPLEGAVRSELVLLRGGRRGVVELDLLQTAHGPHLRKREELRLPRDEDFVRSLTVPPVEAVDLRVIDEVLVVGAELRKLRAQRLERARLRQLDRVSVGS